MPKRKASQVFTVHLPGGRVVHGFSYPPLNVRDAYKPGANEIRIAIGCFALIAPEDECQPFVWHIEASARDVASKVGGVVK